MKGQKHLADLTINIDGRDYTVKADDRVFVSTDNGGAQPVHGKLASEVRHRARREVHPVSYRHT